MRAKKKQKLQAGFIQHHFLWHFGKSLFKERFSLNKNNIFTKKSGAGFTLIELLVVLSILGLLSSITLTTVVTARSKSRDAVLKQNVKTLSNSLQAYVGDYGYPYVSTSTQDNVPGDSGLDVCGFYACPSAPTAKFSLQPLIDRGYLSKAIITPDGNPNNIIYMHRLGPNGAVAFSPQTIVNYCQLGGSCGFTNPSATFLSCIMNGGRNPDNTMATPKAQAALFFSLENGVSPDFGKGLNDGANGNSFCFY